MDDLEKHKNLMRCSLGFDVKAILAESDSLKRHVNVDDADIIINNTSKPLSDTEEATNPDENFDSELIELNNQIKQLLIRNDIDHVKSDFVSESSSGARNIVSCSIDKDGNILYCFFF